MPAIDRRSLRLCQVASAKQTTVPAADDTELSRRHSLAAALGCPDIRFSAVTQATQTCRKMPVNGYSSRAVKRGNQ
ncbi:hypothetical protein BaRGS_00010843 [Batillaria attramentaria]|uniref:Uncharacterized protein n=1 Tax=Batillaria attramentaria TaxID=370345 RepID=A0ABD0LET2_9CAEN